mgnify:CR=1 FL=1
MMNPKLTSLFIIPCSLFDIPLSFPGPLRTRFKRTRAEVEVKVEVEVEVKCFLRSLFAGHNLLLSFLP